MSNSSWIGSFEFRLLIWKLSNSGQIESHETRWDNQDLSVDTGKNRTQSEVEGKPGVWYSRSQVKVKAGVINSDKGC